MERANRILSLTYLHEIFQLSTSAAALLLLFLLVYLLSLVGNGFIVLIVALDRSLHTPMYLFICNLSLVELWYTTQSLCPKCWPTFPSLWGHLSSQLHHPVLLSSLWLPQNSSFSPPWPMTTMRHLQTAHHPLLLSPSNVVPWLASVGVIPLPHVSVPPYTDLLLHLTRSTTSSVTLTRFSALLCTDTYLLIQAVGYAFSTVIILGALVFTMASHAHILATILAMASAAALGRRPFSTCTAHLPRSPSTLALSYSCMSARG